MLQQGLGTLDSKIDQKAGALRSNPQAMGQLQQQQKTQLGKGITPDLMDALAAQKVLSEKADAKRQLALSQEQNPATVAEQYEQQLMTMNKEELTAQTAGIMGERNKQKQKQLSAAAPPQNPQQQQQQRPPMPQGGAPQGIAGAPRPPTQFAAQGGIIGYQGGGQIDKIKAFIASRGGKLSQQEMADLVNASKNNPEVIAFLTQDQGYISSEELMEMDKAAGLTAPTGAPVANASIAAATAKGLSKDKPNTGIATVPAVPAGGLITDKLLTEIGITRAQYDALPEAVKKGYIADAQKKADKTANQAGMQEKLAQPGKNIRQMVEGIASVGAEARAKRKIDYEAYKKNEALKTLGTTPAVVKSPVVDPTGQTGLDALLADKSLMQEEKDQVAAVGIPVDPTAPAVGVPVDPNAPAVTPPKPLQGTMDKAGITPDQLTSESLRGANFPVNTSKNSGHRCSRRQDRRYNADHARQ
jgi:hypothetical protein